MGTEVTQVLQGRFRTNDGPQGQKRHRSFVEDGLVLAVIGRRALVDRLGVGGGRIQTGYDQLLL